MNSGREARRAGRLLALALGAAVLLVYGRSLWFGFVAWDDPTNVADNPFFDPPTLRSLAHFWSGTFEHLYVPLSYSVWWGIAFVSRTCVGRLEPAFFHGANLLLHVGCAWLVLRWLSALLEDRRAAFAGALLFALHPLQVESVCWVSELRGLVSAGLGFGALLFFLRGRERTALALFGLALLAKPAAVAFAPLLLLVELVWQRRTWREVLRRFWPWLLLAGAAAAVSLRAQSAEVLRAATPLADRPAVALDALGFYLRKLAWPAGLCAEYGRSPQLVSQSLPLWPAMLALLLALGAVLGFPERRRAACALGWITLALLPVLGLLPFGYQEKSTVADRYSYVALAGAALFVALGVRRWGRPALAGALALASACGALSFAQAETWRDTRSLFERVLEINPRSFAAHDNLGYEAIQRGDFERARAQFQRALELEPDNAPALSNLGACECELGRPEEGLAHLRQSIVADPRYIRARENLVVALGRTGRLDEAEAAARELAAIDPENATTLLPLVRVLRARGERAEAVELLRRVLARLPGWGPALAEQAALAR